MDDDPGAHEAARIVDESASLNLGKRMSLFMTRGLRYKHHRVLLGAVLICS
jgi:hypothetical protein